MIDPRYQQILDTYGFLSLLTYGGNEYIGIIQNSDDIVTSIYDYGYMRTIEQKTLFLELGEQWWNESNRIIPINLFLKQDWIEYRPSLKTFNSKDVAILHGPTVSLKKMGLLRTKRRSITLIRRVK